MVNLQSGGRAHHLLPVIPSPSTSSSQSLTDKLSQAFKLALQQSGIDPSSFKLTIQPNSAQINGTGPNPAASPSTAAAKLGFNALIPPDHLAAPVNNYTPPVQHWYGADAVDDAYWSKQPAAVQQLREIDNMDQRHGMAAQLAAAGYQIDVPIMVWGWDAGKTMALRSDMGYTWVPSALQKPVSAAPGLTGPGITPYDPKNPPPGSIHVG